MDSFVHFKEIESTNEYLKTWMHQEPLEEGTLVVADFQSAGRGQLGNRWEAEAGKNLLMSLLLRPQFLEPVRHFLLSEMVSLALVEVLDSYCKGFEIKWPNDLYFGDHKVGGILIENEWMGNRIENSVIGIGLNVNQSEFRDGAPNPISLYQILGREIPLDELTRQVVESIWKTYLRLAAGEQESLEQDYYRKLYRRKGLFPYEDVQGRFYAEIKTVSPDGRIELYEPESRKHRYYYFKEVRFIHE
jgi:BirA family transcriptional regulator, biotin operon repressor / biotin---[acetyl-CoA-carboxylase] ligase